MASDPDAFTCPHACCDNPDDSAHRHRDSPARCSACWDDGEEVWEE